MPRLIPKRQISQPRPGRTTTPNLRPGRSNRPNPRDRSRLYGHTDNDEPTALVLSGGGAKGSFEAGVLAYLLRDQIWDKINLRFVCGTSVGSINALKIAESGRIGIGDLVSLYLSLQSEDDMYLDQQWLIDVKAIAKSEFGLDFDALEISERKIRKRLKSDILFGLDRTKFVMANIFTLGFLGCKALEEAQAKFEALGKIINKALNASSLYTLKPIEDKLRENVDFKQFGSHLSQYIKMRLAVVSLEDACTYYVTEDAKLFKGHASNPPLFYDLNPTKGADGLKNALITGVLASSAIPSVFEKKQFFKEEYFDTTNFVDGGVRDVVPVRAALELGAKRVIAILASPVVLAAEANHSYDDANMIDIGSRSLDILTTEIKSNEIIPEFGTWPNDVERIIVDPEILVHGTQEVNPGTIGINMCYGYMRAYETTQKPLLGIDLGRGKSDALYKNTRTIISTRMKIWDIEHNFDSGGPLLQLKSDWIPPDSLPSIPVKFMNAPLQAAFIKDQLRRERAIVFNPSVLKLLRQQKLRLLELVEERMQLLDYDKYSLPLKLEGPPATPFMPLTPSDWWEKWERHGNKRIPLEDWWDASVVETFYKMKYITKKQRDYLINLFETRFDDFYARWTIWEKLPIDFSNGTYSYESASQVINRPIPTDELKRALGI
jgi:predicted acylesterase/phospholipase RssA